MLSIRRYLLSRPLWIALPALFFSIAQGALAQQANDEATPSTGAEESLQELIETLESESAREELISDLKALVEARQEPEVEDPAPELASALRLDEVAQEWKEDYVGFVEDYGLNASLVGYLTASVGLILLALIAAWIARKLINLAYRKLLPVIARHSLNHRRVGIYITVLRFCAYAVIAAVAVGALATLWGVELDRWIPEHFQVLFVQALVSIIVVFVIGAAVIEVADSALEYFFKSRLANQTARMNTLLPIARTVVLLTLFTLFGLTLLSQLGLNVMPLLAGAGVVGFAVGFGAQTLIKDVLTGFIVIVEDLIQVGDVASLGGKAGLVEKITIRKVQLRDLAGTVFTVPFSEVSIVENLTKDFSYYLMDIGVAYREDTDRVVELLQQIDQGMREDENYKHNILEPIEILGVDKFADSAVIIKARIKTIPLQQWGIGREFNRRMKKAFDEHNVEIPFPHRTLYFGEDTDGTAPPARISLLNRSANDAPVDESAN